MHHILNRILFFFLLLIPILSFSQILAPTANYSDTVNYGAQDSVFVFNVDNDDTYLLVDTASLSGQNFTWQEYTPGIGYNDMGTNPVRLEIASTPASQGYRLVLADTTVYCWVIINDFEVEVLSKDEEGNISKDALTSSDCIWIGYIEVAYRYNRIYYNPSTHDSIQLGISYESDYTADPQPEDGYGVLYEADILNGNLRFGINNSYWEDAVYDIQLTDETGLMRSDDVNVTAIRPRAFFETPEHVSLNDKSFYPDRDTLYYAAYDDEYNLDNNSSPGMFLFISDARNADSIVWHFGDSTSVTTALDTITYEYYAYGTYEVRMEAINYFENRQECYDYSEKEPVTLKTPELSAPNVFSPPGGQFPIWRYHDVSITDFEIAIYNRYGSRVHYFQGNIRDWGGWDGSKNNSSNYVSTGVYYYILKDFSHSPRSKYNTDENLEGPVFEDPVYKGAIHVYNTEQ